MKHLQCGPGVGNLALSNRLISWGEIMKNLITLVFSMCLLGAFSTSAFSADLEQIGTFEFPTSASGEAQRHFTLGVGYLHSFGWKQARTEFRKAQEIDPDFALAYWGESLTYNHPLIPVLQDPDSPQDTLNRLGSTSEERLSKAPTNREKGFLRAAEAFAFTEGSLGDKRLAWMYAMLDLYEEFPEDREVIAFTAVAMLSGATVSKENRVLNNFLTESGTEISMQAGAMAMDIFRENPNHPGAAHYIIHSFDHPTYAPLALSAAEKYASIAPAVSHARHMPTHIFIQHGMWDRVAEWNDSAFLAGWDLWEPGDAAGDQNHSSDWGQYGDLQRGNFDRSEMWINRASDVLANNPGDGRSTGTLKTMKARHIIETENWETYELTDSLNSDELLALGLSAANLGDLDLAQAVADRLEDLSSQSPSNTTLNLISMEISALTMFKKGQEDEAVALLMEAVSVAENQSPPRGAASPLKPVHELAGDLLLAMGSHDKAAELYETSLGRMANRPRALLGAARSYAGMSDEYNARQKFQAFYSLWKDTDIAAVDEVEDYLGL
jgi:tetratricopeptide (TPR) repeat protein